MSKKLNLGVYTPINYKSIDNEIKELKFDIFLLEQEVSTPIQIWPVQE